LDAEPYGLRKIGINLNQLDGYRDIPIEIKSESDFNLINDETEIIKANDAKLKYLPKLPESLLELYCTGNDLKSLPELPENLKNLSCRYNKLKSLLKLPEGLETLCCTINKLKSLPELPDSLKYLECWYNPLEYPIPHKFYKFQSSKWLEELNLKLSSYKHQKSLIENNGIYIMKKYEHHLELINDKNKEEYSTYFLSVECGF